jgi:hypothetical protein
MSKDAKQLWEGYKARELAVIKPILQKLGFELADEQPHLGGERYLMQAVTTQSGKKLILIGHRVSDGKKVVIKTAAEPAGKRELRHERRCRQVLKEIGFAYQVFFSPEEIIFTERDGRLISIQAFIEQEKTFLERPLKEQFDFALKAFKAQESAHATTYKHVRIIERTFGSMGADGYLHLGKTFNIDTAAREFLEKNKNTIDQYCGFLTHTDFVPHNFRIKDGTMYLLDHSSLRFGNKYEGWARFINFMELHNPPLAAALVQYVRDNRTQEELLALKCMRIYRLGEIIWYYRNTLPQSTGDLLKLNEARVHFWSEALKAVSNDREVPFATIESYKKTRDTLRSEDEKRRQVGLH